MLAAIYRLVCRLWLGCHGYRFSSKLYRAIWEREFADVAIRTYFRLEDLTKLLSLNAGRWRPDGWRQFFDAVSRPGKAQAVFDGKYEPNEGFDCDDFAVYIVTALEKSLANGMSAPLSEPRFFTVLWTEGFLCVGHNVCLVTVPYGYAWIDYGTPSARFQTPGEVAQAIWRVYRKRDDGKFIGFAISDADLKPLKLEF